jgi:hypothetical protein
MIYNKIGKTNINIIWETNDKNVLISATFQMISTISCTHDIELHKIIELITDITTNAYNMERNHINAYINENMITYDDNRCDFTLDIVNIEDKYNIRKKTF